jgi:beta-glucanase (GH16 family)
MMTSAISLASAPNYMKSDPRWHPTLPKGRRSVASVLPTPKAKYILMRIPGISLTAGHRAAPSEFGTASHSSPRDIRRGLTALFLVYALFGAAPDANSQCAALPDCTLLWSDEFAGATVDTNKWEFMIGDGSAYGIPGWGNNELQYYTSNNTTVANGELTIQARQETVGGLNYTSARLRTLNKGDWTFGRIEMRAKLPVGQGMWPAFWMLPSVTDYGFWPQSGEIDIMETIGSIPEQVHGTLHYGGEFPAHSSSGASTFLPTGTAQNWHEYGIEWQSGEIRWYIDDQLFSTKNTWFTTAAPFPAPFDVDFHVLLNLAVGGNWPGPPNGSTVFPQNYVIDYVRVYGLPVDPPPATELIFDDMEHGAPFGNGWFSFNGGVGGGGLDANFADLPPANGGLASLQTGWGSGGTPGFFGGFGRNRSLDITGMTHFSFWINPDAGQDFRLEINLQDDDNGDGVITNPDDDEFQYVCVVSATGPCAISGGGWQPVSIPLTDFLPDNSFVFGGNDILDTQAGGNGALETIVVAVISNSGADATFRTDYWIFEDLTDTDADGLPDTQDNCPDDPNGPLNPDPEGGTSQQDDDSDGLGNACDLLVATTALPSGRAGKVYNQQLAAVRGTPPYTWTILSGSPPIFVTLSSDGLFHGEVQSTFLTFFTVQVTDDTGDTATQDLSIRITIPNCVNCHSASADSGR